MSPLVRFEPADWRFVPSHLHAQIERYVADGIPPKSTFLGDVLNGDLRRAVRHGSPVERHRLASLCSWMEDHAPSECWGSAAACVKWCELRGLRGVTNTDTGKMYGDDRKRGPFRLWKPGRGEED